VALRVAERILNLIGVVRRFENGIVPLPTEAHA
jgi:hypothetical protein